MRAYSISSRRFVLPWDPVSEKTTTGSSVNKDKKNGPDLLLAPAHSFMLSSRLVLLSKLSKLSELLLQRPSHGYSPSHKRRQRHQGKPRYPPLHYDHRFTFHSILPRLIRLPAASHVTPNLSAASATVTLSITISAPDYPLSPTGSACVANVAFGYRRPVRTAA